MRETGYEKWERQQDDHHISGVPLRQRALPTRNETYFRSADVIAIRDAVRALALVIAEEQCELVFGGHPAILPMIRLQLSQLGLSVGRHVTVFVSEFFKSDFPQDLSAFEKTVVVGAVAQDKEQSLAAMRERMLEGQFSCGIFLGGWRESNRNSTCSAIGIQGFRLIQ